MGFIVFCVRDSYHDRYAIFSILDSLLTDLGSGFGDLTPPANLTRDPTVIRFIVYIIIGMAVLGAMFTWLQQTGDLDAVLERLDGDGACSYNRHGVRNEQNPVVFRESQGKYVAQDPDCSPISIELAHKADPALLETVNI